MFLNEVVIGSSVQSMLYAFFTDRYHILNPSFLPLFYERLDMNIFGTKNTKEIWTRLKLMNSFLVKELGGVNLRQIRIEDKKIRMTYVRSVVEHEFDKCFVFNTENLLVENEIAHPAETEFKVVDDFEVNNLGKQALTVEIINRRTPFINKVNFYTSGRIDGAKYVTDCVSESTLTKEQLGNVDYSDTIAKFIIQDVLKKTYKNPIVSHRSRKAVPVERTVYKNSESVKFLNLSLEEIVDACSA